MTTDLLQRTIKIKDAKETKDSAAREMMREAMSGNDFAAVLRVGDLQTSIQRQLEESPMNPPLLKSVQRMTEVVQFVELSGNLTTKPRFAAALQAANETATHELERLIGQSLQELSQLALREQASEFANRLGEPSAAIQAGENAAPDATQMLHAAGIAREGNRLVVKFEEGQFQHGEPFLEPVGPDQSSTDMRLFSYITPQTVFAAMTRPQRFLTYAAEPRLKMQTALGFDPANVETVLLIVEPRASAIPQMGIVARFAAPFEMHSLSPQLTSHTIPNKLRNGKFYLRSNEPDDPQKPSFIMADDRTLIAASEELLRRMVKQNAGAKPAVCAVRDRLARAAIDQDLVVVLELEQLRPLVRQQLRLIPPFAAELEPIRRIPDLVQFVEYRTSLTRLDLSLSVSTANKAAAKELNSIVGGLSDRALRMVSDQISAQFPQTTSDPVDLAWSQYLRRSATAVRNVLRPTVVDERLVLDGRYTVSGTATAVALLLPAVNAARVAAARNQSVFQSQRIASAWMEYEKARGQFPARANFDSQGKPLLSCAYISCPFWASRSCTSNFI